MQVTLYTKPECQPCRATKRKFDELEIIYHEVDVTLDHTASRKVDELGYMSLPVAVVDLGEGATWSWTGYAPSQIERLHLHLEGLDEAA